MLNEIWVTVFTLIKSIVGDVDVKSKGTLQKQIDDCFTSASNGKAAIASAITGKGVSTASDATFATMAANIGNIKTSPKLQVKNAALSTAAQTIKPDTGYDGLSQVAIPAVSGNAGTGDVLSGKTFSSGSAGISKTGTMPNKGAWTGTVAAASKITIPAGYHNGNGYAQCTDKGYNQGVTDADNRINTNSANYKGGYNAGVSAADGRVNTNSVNYKGGYNAGVSAADGRVNAESANYKGGYNAGVSATKKGTAGTGDVLAGKTFTNSSSVGASGTMPNKGNTTQDAGEVTQDDTYTYLTVPANGYYNTASKLRTKNSNLRHTVNNCFRVTPGTSVLVRAAATLWGTAVNFSGGSVYYLDGITEIAVTKIAGATAKLQIIPYNIDNNTADISNSKNINAGNSLTENFIGYYVVTPYVNASNTTTVSNSSKSATLKVDFS